MGNELYNTHREERLRLEEEVLAAMGQIVGMATRAMELWMEANL